MSSVFYVQSSSTEDEWTVAETSSEDAHADVLDVVLVGVGVSQYGQQHQTQGITRMKHDLIFSLACENWKGKFDGG